MNYGYQNELDFVELFNNKHIYELDNNSQNFLYELFEEIIDEEEEHEGLTFVTLLKKC